MRDQLGIKIKKISAAMLYEVNLGIRDYFTYKEAMFDNSLFCLYLQKKGLNIQNGKKPYTRDIVCLDFDFGSPSYQKEVKKLTDLLKTDLSDEARQRIEAVLQKYSPKKIYIPKKRGMKSVNNFITKALT